MLAHLHQFVIFAADQPAAAPDDTNAIFRLLMPLVVIMALFYFMMIRPQKRKEQELRDQVSNLKENDRVLTIGGIYGVVTNVQRDAQRPVHLGAIAGEGQPVGAVGADMDVDEGGRRGVKVGDVPEGHRADRGRARREPLDRLGLGRRAGGWVRRVRAEEGVARLEQEAEPGLEGPCGVGPSMSSPTRWTRVSLPEPLSS